MRSRRPHAISPRRRSADGRFAALAAYTPGKPIMLLRHPGPSVAEATAFPRKTTTLVLRLSPAGDRLVAAAFSGMELWDTATGKQPVALERKDIKDVRDLGWLGGQRLVGLVTAKANRGIPGAEEWVVVWDVTTGKILHTATNRTAMDVLAVAPDGHRFAEAGADKNVRIRDAATLAVQQEFRAHDGPITALAWHPTQPLLATASTDLSIRLWNLETGRRLEEFHGPTAAPSRLDFSPTGQRLACSSSDGTRIWDAAVAAQIVPSDSHPRRLGLFLAAQVVESGRQRVVKLAVKAEWWAVLKACYERLRTWLSATAPQLEAAGAFLRRLARQTTEAPEEIRFQPAPG